MSHEYSSGIGPNLYKTCGVRPEGVGVSRILEYARNTESIFALHYAFSGQFAADTRAADSPLAFLMIGGLEVDDIEVGYGSARAFDSQQLSEIVGALDTLDSDEAVQRLLDPRASGPQPKVQLSPRMPARAPNSH